MKKKIIILGSTGSIGLSALNIIDKKKEFFSIYLLSANKNSKLIYKQIKKYKPQFFIINNLKTFKILQKKLKKSKTKILNNFNSIKLKKKIDITITAIPGIAGLEPTIKTIKLTKKILIANKESVICGWNLINKTAKKNRTKIIPIDSEHFSIFKLLKKRKMSEIKKIYLTASGGPFLNYKPNQLKSIKSRDALKHPKWKMGKKITIDSSTLMNKIFELIEAKKLFTIPNNKLDIVIHPESLVHAIIDFKNGLKEFIYHETSMIIPLANAIFDGNIDIKNFYEKKNKEKIKNLTFRNVDKKIFPAIKLKNRIDEYPSTPIILNAANEILVEYFLRKIVTFSDISKFIMGILNDGNYKNYAITSCKNINQINKIDTWARSITLTKINRKYGQIN